MKRGCLTIIIVLLAVIIAVFVALNPAVLDISTVMGFGVEQYANNVAHFHRDKYIRTLREMPAYRSIMPLVKADTASMFTLPERVILLRGFTPRGSVTWVAAKAYRGKREVNFYLMIPEPLAAVGGDATNTCFEPVPASYFVTIRTLYAREYRSMVRDRVAVTEPTDNIEEQKLREDRTFAEVTNIGVKAVFIKRADMPLVRRIHEFYLGRKNEAIRLLQLDDSFTLMTNF
ncbi:MAG: hypothetical protein AABZ39_03775 [Spirochaetota bacterium]